MSYNPTGLPYRKWGLDGQDAPPSYGGDVIRAIAGATLLVGDVVYWTLLNTVNKSAVAADYVVMAGVVVGGPTLGDEVVADDILNSVGAQAGTVGQTVWVQTTGIAPVLAAAAIAVNTRVQVAVTAGRVDDVAFVAGQVVGIVLKAAINPGDKVPMQIVAR